MMSQPEPNGSMANGTSATSQAVAHSDAEVVPKAERRRFTAEYKQRILAEADQCHARGQVGALLRREGLYASHLDKWRQHRDRAIHQALTPQKRGRKVDRQANELDRCDRKTSGCKRVYGKLRRSSTSKKSLRRSLERSRVRRRATRGADGGHRHAQAWAGGLGCL